MGDIIVFLRQLKLIPTHSQWLHRTFLYQRIQLNPKHYGLGKDDRETWQDRLDALVLEAVEGLQQRGLIELNPEADGALISTAFGETMSKVATSFSKEAIILTRSTALHSSSDGTSQ
jgi:hypothetical protein